MPSYATNMKKQQQRDLAIMEALSAGPMTGKDIYKKFFTKDDGKLVSRQAFKKRMARLEGAQHIKKKIYHRIKDHRVAVYVLGEAGISEVSLSCSIPRDEIRAFFPSASSLYHEYHLARIIRAIRRESERKAYELVYMHDDRMLRRMNKRRKAVFYPDLKLGISPKGKEPFELNVEFDAGGKRSEYYWQNKIASWRQTTVVISTSPQRLEEMADLISYAPCFQKVGFAVIDCVITRGLAGTDWYWLHDRQRSKLDLF
jgi:hypothetical protein